MTSRFVSPFPAPEGRKRELLEILCEECLEVGQRVQKAQRFGLPEIQPNQEFSNAQRIMHEMADVMAVYGMLVEENVLPPVSPECMAAKRAKLNDKYLQNG